MILERQDSASSVRSQPPGRRYGARRGGRSAGCERACIFPEKQDYKGKDMKESMATTGAQRGRKMFLKIR